MKILLVSESSSLRPYVSRIFSFQQTDVIHYANPIKAMDNLEEIEPEVVLFSAADFPRHWKPFVIFLRNIFHRHESIFILLIGETFETEEADKAEHLQVNAVISDDLASRYSIERIRGIITRYHQNTDIRRTVRYMPSAHDRIRMVFTNPHTFRVCSGTVSDISTGGMRFQPDDAVDLEHLDDHTVVPMASLRLGDRIYPVVLRVIRVQETIAFEFAELPVDTEQAITEYIGRLAGANLDGSPA